MAVQMVDTSGVSRCAGVWSNPHSTQPAASRPVSSRSEPSATEGVGGDDRRPNGHAPVPSRQKRARCETDLQRAIRVSLLGCSPSPDKTAAKKDWRHCHRTTAPCGHGEMHNDTASHSMQSGEGTMTTCPACLGRQVAHTCTHARPNSEVTPSPLPTQQHRATPRSDKNPRADKRHKKQHVAVDIEQMPNGVATWVGESCGKHGTRQHYNCFAKNGQLVTVNDCVYVKPEEKDQASYILRVRSMWLDTKSQVMCFRGQWLYRPQDTKQGAASALHIREVFLSDWEDDNPIECVQTKCHVSFQNPSEDRDSGLEKKWHYVSWRSYCVRSGDMQSTSDRQRNGQETCEGSKDGMPLKLVPPPPSTLNGKGSKDAHRETAAGGGGGSGWGGSGWERKFKHLEAEVSRGELDVQRVSTHIRDTHIASSILTSLKRHPRIRDTRTGRSA